MDVNDKLATALKALRSAYDAARDTTVTNLQACRNVMEITDTACKALAGSIDDLEVADGWDKNPKQIEGARDALAFPQPGANGMTTREYFAAHAPAQPEFWFEPNIPMVERAELPLPHGNVAYKEHCDKCREYFKERERLDHEHDKKQSEYKMSRFVIWRWAYADAMIAAQTRQ